MSRTPPLRHSRRLVALLALGASLCSGACSTGRRVDTSSLLGAERAAELTLASELAYPTPDREAVSEWSDRAADAEAVVRRVAAPAADVGSWVVTDTRDGRTITEDLYVRGPKGDVALVRSTNHVERVVSWFAPALVVMPAELAPGETFRQTSTIKIFPIDDQDNVRDQGPVTQELTLEAEQDFARPAGQAPAMRVRAVFTADLSAADVVKTTDLWFDAREKGGGLAGERSEEVVKALGLTIRTTRRFLVREAP